MPAISPAQDVGGNLATGGTLPTGPTAGDMDLSPFYRWAAAFPAKPGAMLREEAVASQPEMTSAKEAFRILYASSDARWHSGRIPVSGMLYLPDGAAPKGGWPLVAWGHGTLGIADICAPSWTGFKPRDASYINRWLEAGFAVVATDYQGLGGPGPHPYLHWGAEARSLLDAVRAALGAKPGLIANEVLVAGHSQGSGAALGAATIWRDYAPELNILGAVATALNTTFPEGPVSLPVRNSSNMFLSLVAGGLRDDGPRIDDIISPAGKQLLDMARRGCSRQMGGLARELKVRSLAETLSISQEELDDLRIPVTDMPMGSLSVPLFIGTGLADTTLPPHRQYAAVSALCASRNIVAWHRYEGLTHDGVLHGSFADALAFARTVIEGGEAKSQCHDVVPPGPPGDARPGAIFNSD